MRQSLPIILTIILTACQPIDNPHEHDTIVPVSNVTWQGKHPYPFIAERGEIACDNGALYYFPNDNFDQGKEGYPLNDVAKKQSGDYDLRELVKNGVDLGEVVAIGLGICERDK